MKFPDRKPRIRSIELIQSPQPDRPFDPTKDIHPTLLDSFRSKVEKIPSELRDAALDTDELFFVLESYLYINPSEATEVIGGIENYLKLGTPTPLEKKIEEIYYSATGKYPWKLVISLCHLFPDLTPEIRENPRLRYVDDNFDEALDEIQWDNRRLNFEDCIALGLLIPKKMPELQAAIVEHVDKIRNALDAFRKGDAWDEFADLLIQVLPIAPGVKTALGVTPEDIAKMKDELKSPPTLSVHFHDAARIVRALVYYESPNLRMTENGQILLEAKAGSLDGKRPLPERIV